MKYSIKLTIEARTDIKDSIAWYSEQKESLGREFFDNIVKTLKLIRSNPHIFQIRYRQIRQAPVRKFPFQIHYLAEDADQRIVVIAVLHTSRNPQIWKERS